MGLRIDRLAITILLAGALYIFFMNMTGNIPVAAAAAFIAMAAIKKLSSKLPTDRFSNKRRRIAAAKSELERYSLSDPENAGRNIHNVLRQEYAAALDGVAVYPLIRHPCGSAVTADDIVSIWRSMRHYERGVIATTARADENAHRLARQLKDPEIRLIDSDQLAILMAGHVPLQTDVSAPRTKNTGRFAAIMLTAGRAKAGKCLFTGVLMLILFLISGVPVYLLGALVLIFISFVCMRKRRMPKELFTK